MTADQGLEALKKALRHKLRDASGLVSIAAAELRTLLDEIGRLHQSNERLRRQNRRVRLKLQRAGLEAPEGDVEAASGSDDSTAGGTGENDAP